MTVYECSKQKQLVDLNGNAINFKLDFQIQSENHAPFYAIITTQRVIDEKGADGLDFKLLQTGEMSGSIVADKNYYENYLLVIYSDTPTKVYVHLKFEPLENNLPQMEDAEKSAGQNFVSAYRFVNDYWSIAAVALLLVALAIGARYWLRNQSPVEKKGKKSESLLEKLKSVNID